METLGHKPNIGSGGGSIWPTFEWMKEFSVNESCRETLYRENHCICNRTSPRTAGLHLGVLLESSPMPCVGVWGLEIMNMWEPLKEQTEFPITQKWLSVPENNVRRDFINFEQCKMGFHQLWTFCVCASADFLWQAPCYESTFSLFPVFCQACGVCSTVITVHILSCF